MHLAAFLDPAFRPTRRGRMLAALAAAGVCAIGAAVLARAAGLGLSAHSPWWLAVFGAVACVLALAAALIIDRARAAARERALETARAALAGILADQGLAILRLNVDGDILETFGTPLAPLCAQLAQDGLWALADQPGRLRAAVDQAMVDGRSEVGFAPAGAADGWMWAVITRHGEDFIATLRDASADHAREAALEKAASEAEAHNAGKTRFLANMSHELRTPLNAVIGFSDIMRSAMFGPLNDKYAEYAALIHESGRHLLDLINDLLDMSKIEAHRYELSREVFDAREAVSGALRLTRVQADGAKVDLRGELPGAPLRVIADARALKQIVLNLVANALKFTPAGGAVTVTLSGEAETLTLSVADTGIGIAPEDLARLGSPYEQAGGADQKALGAGLGLSLVRAFSELHGGAMTIESTLGRGTRVDVRLPVLLPAQEPPAALGPNVVALHPRR